MKTYPRTRLLDYGKMETYFVAEQFVSNGLLSYTKRKFAPTRMEAITRVLTDIYF